MYLAVNISRHIAILGSVLLLNASCMTSQILKCTGTPSPSHLLMRFHGPQICSLILFWQPIIPLTYLSASIVPYLKHQRVGYAQILLISVTENPILGVVHCLLSRFSGESTIQGG